MIELAILRTLGGSNSAVTTQIRVPYPMLPINKKITTVTIGSHPKIPGRWSYSPLGKVVENGDTVEVVAKTSGIMVTPSWPSEAAWPPRLLLSACGRSSFSWTWKQIPRTMWQIPMVKMEATNIIFRLSLETTANATMQETKRVIPTMTEARLGSMAINKQKVMSNL